MLETVASWLIGGWVVGNLIAWTNLRWLNRKTSQPPKQNKFRREDFWLRIVTIANLMLLAALGLMAWRIVESLAKVMTRF